MRLTGDPEACWATARTLDRVSRLVSGAYVDPLTVPTASPAWQGSAADAWWTRARVLADGGRLLADRLAAAARALSRYAAELDDLQRQACALTEEAAAAGLALDADGRIPPVVVAVGPPSSAEQRHALHQQEVRERVTARARGVLLRAADAALRVGAELDRLHPLCPQVDAGHASTWALVPWDLPPLLVTAAGELPRRLLLASTPLSGLAATTVDVAVNDLGVGEAVAKNVTATVAGALAAGIVVLALPEATVASVVAGAATGLATGKLWDARRRRTDDPAPTGAPRAPSSTPLRAPRPSGPVRGPARAGVPAPPVRAPGRPRPCAAAP